MSQEFTFAQVKEHAAKKDLFMIVHDKVYDVTKFVDEHPYVFAPINPFTLPLAQLDEGL